MIRQNRLAAGFKELNTYVNYLFQPKGVSGLPLDFKGLTSVNLCIPAKQVSMETFEIPVDLPLDIISREHYTTAF